MPYAALAAHIWHVLKHYGSINGAISAGKHRRCRRVRDHDWMMCSMPCPLIGKRRHEVVMTDGRNRFSFMRVQADLLASGPIIFTIDS